MSPERQDPLSALEDALGHHFVDRSLLVRALTHSSYANDRLARLAAGGASRAEEGRDNETLEFLGDSVLGFLVSEKLFEAFPSFREGALSKARSHLVSEAHFASLARTLGLGELIRLAVGESRSGGHKRDSLLADAFEAVFAALLLDGGLEVARAAAARLFAEDIARLDPAGLSYHDYKTSLQELAQAEGKAPPVYRLREESGPDHDKRFVYEVDYDGTLRATGVGPSKKDAQREAAKAALALKVGPAP